jgi:hypothetical protein
MTRRTFTAVVGGESYEIPTSMTVLREAEEVSGAQLMDAVINGNWTAMVQGALCAGLRTLGIERIGDQEISFATPDNIKRAYDTIGDSCDFHETRDNIMAFLKAMAPETSSAKNARAEGSKKRQAGPQSSATPTDSSG